MTGPAPSRGRQAGGPPSERPHGERSPCGRRLSRERRSPRVLAICWGELASVTSGATLNRDAGWAEGRENGYLFPSIRAINTGKTSAAFCFTRWASGPAVISATRSSDSE